MKNIKLVATDLDGTFLKNDRSISPGNLEALRLLGTKNIIRVVATGRNLRKVSDVISPGIPFDYVVYSSGAGIYNWQDQQHIFKQNISMESVNLLVDFFRKKDYSFYAFDPAPENHRLWYHKGRKECEEFDRYYNFNRLFIEMLPVNSVLKNGFCQFLLIIPEDEQSFAGLKNEIEEQCSEIRVIRSSSPVTKGYIWVEVFHREVSKAHGIHHLCKLLSVHPGDTLGIGNDYNDLDLLNFTAYSFITENAPAAIKTSYVAAPSNEEDAFACSVQPLLI